MKTKHVSTLFSTLLFLLSLQSTFAVNVFDVYKMFQLEKATLPYGSQRAIVNNLAASATRSSSLSRHTVLVPLKDFKLEKLDDLINNKNAEAIVVLLPKFQVNHNNDITDADIENWREIEVELSKKTYNVPIYFTWQDDTLTDLFYDIERISGDGSAQFSLGDLFGAANQYQFVASSAESTPVKEVSITNIDGWLSGAVVPEGQTRPTIAVVAHYDAFAVAPGLAVGADSASGVVALLELARLFHKLYQNPRSQAKYNLIFVLTGGGNLNYAGSKHWLSNTDVRLLDTVEYVLCLDSIGSGEGLNLHVSKLPKEENIQKLYQAFNKTATSLGLPFQLVHKKINISNPDIDWEHEQYSRRKIVSGTLSHLSKPLPPLSKSHIYDVRDRISVATLAKNIRFVAESLAKHIYGQQTRDLLIFEGDLAINELFLTAWLDVLTAAPRAAPYLSKKSPLFSGLTQVLSQYTTVTNSTFILESEYVFYEGAEKAVMSVYRSKPVLFDVILLALIGAYLFGIFTILKGPAETIKQVQKLISGSSKKSVLKKKN